MKKKTSKSKKLLNVKEEYNMLESMTKDMPEQDIVKFMKPQRTSHPINFYANRKWIKDHKEYKEENNKMLTDSFLHNYMMAKAKAETENRRKLDDLQDLQNKINQKGR